MSIIIEDNYDCSFMQMIAKLPSSRNLLLSKGVSEETADKLSNFKEVVSRIISFSKPYSKLYEFLKVSWEAESISYVKNFDDEEVISECIVFGEYHRNIDSESKRIFFRIDQNIKRSDIPNFSDSQFGDFFFNIVQFLSGTQVMETIYPELILSQEFLNDTSDIELNSTNIIEELFFFHTNYFSKSLFIDKNGSIYEHEKGDLKIVNYNFIDWLNYELENIFEPRPIDFLDNLKNI